MEKYITHEDGRVTKIIERPSDEQLESGGFYVDEDAFPQPEPPEGFTSRLMVRLPERELYYDYVEVGRPLEVRLSALEQETADHENVTAEMFYYFVSAQDAGEYQTALILNELSEVQETATTTEGSE